MKRSRTTRSLVFVAILILHWTTQFVAWSYAERSSSPHVLWNILATPIVHLSDSATDRYFWTVVTANSILWASVLTYVIGLFAKTRRLGQSR